MAAGGLDQLWRRTARNSGIGWRGGEDTGQVESRAVGVHWAGCGDEIGGGRAGLDMLWHPATSEGLGTSVLDALALGVVPVAFATGGLSETIAHGLSGFLLKTGNIREFADAVSTLAGDQRLSAKLGAHGRKRDRAFREFR